MKSVVAEASSISKAIELAWQKAGQPKEFLIKVYQEPQRNIFGLTKTSAKVGIFFDDAAMVQKIKTASQNVIPMANCNVPQKRANPVNTNPQNKPISPIKPIPAKNNTPKPQAPKLQKPQQTPSAPVVSTVSKPVLEQAPIIEKQSPAISQPINPAVNNASNNTHSSHCAPIVNTQSTSGEEQPRPAAARKKYYRRRKPRTPRPNGDGSTGADQNSGPIINKSDN